jgi:hypothetical protein
MGADYKAKALIGLKLTRPLTQTVKAFEHSYSDEFKYCPKTGRALWEKEVTPVEGYDITKETYLGYPVVRGTDNLLYLALLVSDKTHSNGGPEDSVSPLPEDLLSEMQQFAKTLQVAGLWDRKLFGLWSVLYCSY